MADEIATTFTIPEGLQREGVARTVTLKEPTSGDEMNAAKSGAGNLIAIQFAAVKMCISNLDGKKVEQLGADVEQFWSGCGAKMRTLLIRVYAEMTTASEEEQAAFFNSATTTV